MDPSIGPLAAADETLLHQTADTFATVGPTDLGWTEKIWSQACARDGSLQASFGLGKYTNRNVMDAFGGISRGREQWTVRASRALHTDPETATVGPLRYEIVTPLDAVRIVLEPNDVQPIAFDVILRGVVPARMEDRELLRSPRGGRRTNDVVRYHQTGLAEGWVEIEGRRLELVPSEWMSARDHSWGVRTNVGEVARDLEPTAYPPSPRSLTSWSPVLMERADGSHYALFHYLTDTNLPGMPSHRLRGGVEHPDGREEPFVDARFEAQFDDTNRRFLGGTITFTHEDGTARPLAVTPISDTGFHLGTGLYFGLDGQRHGMWRGELHVDGDYLSNCADPDVARRIHQHRDCVVRVEDPAEGATGWGPMQTIVIGAFPEYGLTLESTFV
jgi:hypothetical protein